MKTPSVIIDVNGGIASVEVSDGPVDVYIIDNDRQGPLSDVQIEFMFSATPAEVVPAADLTTRLKVDRQAAEDEAGQWPGERATESAHANGRPGPGCQICGQTTACHGYSPDHCDGVHESADRQWPEERATESCVAVPAYNGEPCGGGACACHDLAINGGTEPDYHDMAMEDQMADAAGVGDNGPGRF